VSFALPLLRRRRALATHVTRLACGLSLLVLGGYAHATEEIDAPDGANRNAVPEFVTTIDGVDI